LEESSHASIHPFLASIAEPTPILLRSTKGKGKETSPHRMEPENVLPHTPLSELTTSGLETEQIWEQLELRAPGYIKVAKEIISAGGRPPMDEDEEDMEKEEDEADSEDDDDGEDMTEEEARQMFEDGELGDMTDEQFEEMMRKAEEESEDEDGSDLSDDDDEDEDEEGDSLEGSDEDGQIEFEDGTKIGDSDEDLLDEDDDEEDEDDDEEDEDDDGGEDEDIDMGSDEEPSFNDAEEEGEDQAGPSRRRRHPTLDDQFFSIDDFNRMTEEAEATSLSSGRLDDDEEEELDEDVGQLMLNGVGDDEGMSPFLHRK